MHHRPGKVQCAPLLHLTTLPFWQAPARRARQPEIEKMQTELMQTDLVQIVKPQRLAFKRLPNGPTKANKGGL